MPGVRQGFCTVRDKATYGSIKVLLVRSPSRVARRGGLALQKWRAIPYGGGGGHEREQTKAFHG
jgi:hypothetical protein